MNVRITRAAVTGIGALSLLSVLAAPGVAHAHPAHPGHKHVKSMLMIDGDLTLAPGVRVLHIKAHGHQDAKGRTHGTYVATILDGKHKTPFQVKGPVNCIYTHGDTASLVYPISSTTPELLPASARGQYAVKVSVRKGKVDQVGVEGPMPASSFHGCLPGPTPNTFKGKITIK